MADFMDMSGWANGAAKIGKSIYDMGVWVILLALIGILIGIIIWYFSFKNTVIVRQRTKNGKRIRVCMAKRVIRDGVSYWRIREFRQDVTPPPPDAIETRINGRLHAECYWSDDNPEPVWIKDTNNQEVAFQPFVTQERALHVERLTRAMARKKRSVIDIVLQLAPLFTMIIFIVIVFAFWGDITAPQVEISKSQAAAAASMATATEQQARIMAKLYPGEFNATQTITPAPGG